MMIDEIKRDKCAILSLVLKSKWYDMIDQGEKHEEYRSPTDYWLRRLHNWDMAVTPQKTPVVEFRRGYASNAPRMAFWCFGIETASGMKPYSYIDLPTNKPLHPEWGEPEKPHFFIRLGGRLKITR